MIQANKLRIGNIVKSIVFDKIVYVEEIHGLWIETNYSPLGYLQYKNIEPIPLSEEILLKVGFRKSSSLTPLWSGPDPMLIWRTEYESDLLDNYFEFRFGITESYQAKRQVRLDYLHQLQNLYFALTGQELNTSGL